MQSRCTIILKISSNESKILKCKVGKYYLQIKRKNESKENGPRNYKDNETSWKWL